MNAFFVHCNFHLKGGSFFPYEQGQIRYEKYRKVHEKGEQTAQQIYSYGWSTCLEVKGSDFGPSSATE